MICSNRHYINMYPRPDGAGKVSAQCPQITRLDLSDIQHVKSVLVLQTGTASTQHAVLQLPVIQIQEPSNEDDELDKDSGSKVTIWQCWN